jgi:NAD(P)-dependent dehydrogenase (short-subunit alcohol dehydrogenase family)
LARRFAAGGYAIALLARGGALSGALAMELDDARAYECDVADAASLKNTFARIRADLGEVEVLVYNAGSGSWGSIEQITPEAFEAAWRVNALGALLVAQQVIPAMKRGGAGSIIFIGATASLRGCRGRRHSRLPRLRSASSRSPWRARFGQPVFTWPL